MSKEPIKCPKCGGESGYFHKYIQSHTQFMDFNKQAVDCNSEFVRGGTKKFCSDCEKDITEFVKTLSEKTSF